MYAAKNNRRQVAKVLLEKGANLAVVADERYTALIIAAQEGHPAVVELLVKAGADTEDRDSDGHTPLHLSSHRGYSNVMKVLLEAGARVDSRLPDGATPLYLACETGHRQAVRVLLDANTNPLLAPSGPSGISFFPLDVASQNGHSGLVRDMLEHVGIRGCGGPTGGADALHYAAQDQHLDIMIMLTEVGVVDTGIALIAAVGFGRDASVRFLLRQREARRGTSGVRAYVNDARDARGQTPVYRGVLESPPSASRTIQRLVEAGADVASPVAVPLEGGALTLYTPLGLANLLLRKHSSEEGGQDAASEKKVHTLEATRRLLLRVEAVRATSWLWASGFRVTGVRTRDAQSTALTSMLPIIWRRAARRGMLLAPLLR